MVVSKVVRWLPFLFVALSVAVHSQAQTIQLKTAIQYQGTSKTPQVLITFPTNPKIRSVATYRLDSRKNGKASTLQFGSKVKSYRDKAVSEGQKISYTLRYQVSPGNVAVASASLTIPIISFNPTPTPTPAQTPITLPREVFFNQPTDTVKFKIPAGATISQITTLKLRIHNIDGEDRAAIQFNNATPVSLNNNTVTIHGLGEGYEGKSKLEFPVDTKDLEVAIPPGILTNGINSLTFTYNGFQATGVHRFSMGYRVVKFNLLDSLGNEVLPASAFVDEDPKQWKLNATATDIADGKLLWTTAQLITNPGSSGVPVKAKCADCHVSSGFDLKYFAYSPKSIIARAQFHKLSASDGFKIAAYILSLNVPSPGRPWNPPYQPAPGLDQQPVQNWAAGAGLDATLADDNDLAGHLFPSGQISSSDIALTKKINMRELPAMQLLSWNSWLPKIHPKDAPLLAPGVYDNSAYVSRMNTITAGLGIPGSTASETFIKQSFPTHLHRWMYTDTSSLYDISTWQKTWGEEEALQYYSVNLLRLVKIFGWMQEYNIEGRIQSLVGPTAEIRGWNNGGAFTTTPLHISRSDGGRFALSQEFGSYLGSAWYYLQMILNPGNGKWSDNYPLDGSYIQLIRNELDRNIAIPQAIQSYAIVTRMMQERANNNGLNPHTGFNVGWGQDLTQLFISRTASHNWRGVSPAQLNALLDALTESWLNHVGQFVSTDFNAAGYTYAGEIPNVFNSGTFLERLRGFVGFMTQKNPTSTIKDNLARWAHNQWPQIRFDLIAAGKQPLQVVSFIASNGLAGNPITIKAQFRGPINPASASLNIDGINVSPFAYATGTTVTLNTIGAHTIRICGSTTDNIPSCQTTKITLK